VIRLVRVTHLATRSVRVGSAESVQLCPVQPCVRSWRGINAIGHNRQNVHPAKHAAVPDSPCPRSYPHYRGPRNHSEAMRNVEPTIQGGSSEAPAPPGASSFTMNSS